MSEHPCWVHDRCRLGVGYDQGGHPRQSPSKVAYGARRAGSRQTGTRAICLDAILFLGAGIVVHDIFSSHRGVEDDDMSVICSGAHVFGCRIADQDFSSES